MKTYYVKYYRDFANTFSLFWAEPGDIIPEGLERITRKQALQLASRYADDSFAASWILPVNYPADGDILNDCRFRLVGRIWERV